MSCLLAEDSKGLVLERGLFFFKRRCAGPGNNAKYVGDAAGYEARVKDGIAPLTGSKPIDELLDSVVLAVQSGDAAHAEALLREAAKTAPGRPRLQAVKGLVLAAAGQPVEAIDAYREALRLDPDFVAARYDLAVLLCESGQGEDALVELEAVLGRWPSFAAAHRSRILILSSMTRYDAAMAAVDIALAAMPGCIDFLVARATLLRLTGRNAEALVAIDEPLQAAPAHAPALAEKGSILHALGRYDAALTAFDQALETEESVFALNGVGLVELDTGLPKAALAAFDRALALAPNDFDALFYRTQALEALGRFDEALDGYRAVLDKRPSFAPAINNIGKIKREMGLIDEAIAALRKATAAAPDNAEIYSNLLLTLLYDPAQEPDRLVEEHAEWGRRFGRPPGRCRDWPNDPDPARPLRVGLVSAEFCRHAVGGWLLAALQSLDREQYQLVGYSSRAREDDMTPCFKTLTTDWRSVAGLDDLSLASQIRRDRIDILIDISGHTALNRLPCFALKPAPVQATWLGYPFTTGLDAIDYAIMDDIAVRPGEEHRFFEQVIRLTPSRFPYEPPPALPDVTEPPALRQGWVTFGSFNNIAKLSATVLALWCRILLETPSARLILKSPALSNPAVATRIRTAICGTGISDGRLELRGASDNLGVLHEYGDIDIALDPFPFGGGATSCEALVMGLPIVTLPSWQPVSRQTETCLAAIGRREWVAADADGYAAIAARLARNPQTLERARQTQRQAFLQSAICDKRTFGAELDKQMRRMWKHYCRHIRRESSGPSPLRRGPGLSAASE